MPAKLESPDQTKTVTLHEMKLGQIGVIQAWGSLSDNYIGKIVILVYNDTLVDLNTGDIWTIRHVTKNAVYDSSKFQIRLLGKDERVILSNNGN